MRFTLRQLELFTAIARTDNVSAGAVRVGMSQSAASTALAEMERKAGRPLFDRHQRRVHLNETGRLLLPRAIALLEGAAEVDRILAGDGGPGPLKLGATVTIGNYLAPALIDRYRATHGEAEVDLVIDNMSHIAERILAYELDLGLIEGDYQHADLVVTNWRRDELAIFCAADHPLAGLGEVPIELVLAEKWAVREQGSGTRQTLDRAMGHWASGWRIGVELRQIEAIKSAVMGGRLIGCVSRLALDDALECGRLAELRVPELDLRRRFYTVVRRDKYRTAGMELFLASTV